MIPRWQSVQACRACYRMPAQFDMNLMYKALPSTRHASQFKKPFTPSLPFTIINDPNHPLDRNIRGPLVNVVSPDGALLRGSKLSDMLLQLEKENAALVQDTKFPDTKHIRQVAEDPDDGTPIVKVLTVKSLLAEIPTKKKNTKSTGIVEKRMELNWGVDQKGDLLHKLNKLRELLKDGCRVEVLLAPKRRSRNVELDERQALVQRIREAASSVPGVHEYKEADGGVSRIMTIYLQDATRSDGSDGVLQQEESTSKHEEKERKREERRRKEEERQRKAREKQEALEQARTIKATDLPK